MSVGMRNVVNKEQTESLPGSRRKNSAVRINSQEEGQWSTVAQKVSTKLLCGNREGKSHKHKSQVQQTINQQPAIVIVVNQQKSWFAPRVVVDVVDHVQLDVHLLMRGEVAETFSSYDRTQRSTI